MQPDTGHTFEALTPAEHITVRGQWALVDLDDITTSDRPGYPRELQPRHANTIASREKVAAIATEGVKFELMADSATTDDGAPVLTAHLEAVTANHRLWALRHPASATTAAEYHDRAKAAAGRFGIALSRDMARPVLARIITDTGADLATVAADSNRPKVRANSAAEQAEHDGARILEADILTRYNPSEDGDILTAGNREFLNSFCLACHCPELKTSAGGYTKDTETRVRRAILAAVFSGQPNARECVTALIERAPLYGLVRHLDGFLSQAGQLLRIAGSKPEYDIIPATAGALADLLEYRSQRHAGQWSNLAEYLAQPNLFAEMTPPRTPASLAILHALDNATSAKAVREYFAAYIRKTGTIDTTTADLFGTPNATPAELLDIDTAPAQPDLFTAAAPVPAVPAPVPAVPAPVPAVPAPVPAPAPAPVPAVPVLATIEDTEPEDTEPPMIAIYLDQTTATAYGPDAAILAKYGAELDTTGQTPAAIMKKDKFFSVRRDIWMDGIGTENRAKEDAPAPAAIVTKTDTDPAGSKTPAENYKKPEQEKAMTRRERLEQKADRREEWAESRHQKATAASLKSDLREEVSGIPFGQPILAGHHSEGRHRKAIERANSAAIEETPAPAEALDVTETNPAPMGETTPEENCKNDPAELTAWILDHNPETQPDIWLAGAACKSNDLDEVREYYARDTWDYSRCRIERTATLSGADWDHFAANLMDPYKFLEGKGGHAHPTEDLTLEKVSNMPPEARANFGLQCFALITRVINAETRQSLYVDPQGYTYARYVHWIPEDLDNSTHFDTEYPAILPRGTCLSYKGDAFALLEDSPAAAHRANAIRLDGTDDARLLIGYDDFHQATPCNRILSEAHLQALEKTLSAANLQRMTDRNQQEADRAAAIETGRAFLEAHRPEWAKAAILAILREDESDAMSDYHGSRTLKTLFLGWSKHTRDLFPEMRKAAATAHETAHLAPGCDEWTPIVVIDGPNFSTNGAYYRTGQRSPWHTHLYGDDFNPPTFRTEAEARAFATAAGDPEPVNIDTPDGNRLVSFRWDFGQTSVEHREKYSMGGGFYLKAGYRHASGWHVEKQSLEYNLDTIAEAIGSDPAAYVPGREA